MVHRLLVSEDLPQVPPPPTKPPEVGSVLIPLLLNWKLPTQPPFLCVSIIFFFSQPVLGPIEVPPAAASVYGSCFLT